MSVLFDVVAVSLETNKVRLLDAGKSEQNADAIVNMAVMRRGVEEEFFASVPAEMYKEGDDWRGGAHVSETEESRLIHVNGMSYPRGPRGLDR